MDVLITGAAGQIGTNLALALLRRGDTVVGIDKRPNQWTEQFDTQVVDLVDLARARQPLNVGARPDVIVHLAAWAKVFELVRDPSKAFENVEMVWPVLEMARTAGVPIVFGSSREVYGDLHRHVTDESMADFVVAESPYSASKVAGEAFFYSYARCYGFPYLVFRFSNVYGRYDHDLERMERVIPLFVRRVQDEAPITVFGRDKMLDFTHVDDCTAGVIAGVDALATGNLTGETINLAYGQGQTLFDLVGLIELAVGKQAGATYEPSQTGEVTRYVADISKARQMLGYEPRIPLTQGIGAYVAALRESGWL